MTLKIFFIAGCKTNLPFKRIKIFFTVMITTVVKLSPFSRNLKPSHLQNREGAEGQNLLVPADCVGGSGPAPADSPWILCWTATARRPSSCSALPDTTSTESRRSRTARPPADGQTVDENMLTFRFPPYFSL